MSALDRTLLAAFAIFAAATGVFLLAAPQTFYANVPGVAATGSFNAHFLRDVGLAYVTLAVGAAFALFRPEYALPVTAMAAVNLLGHAALHVFIENSRRCIWERHDRTREAPGIYLPAAFALVLLIRAASAARQRHFRQRT